MATFFEKYNNVKICGMGPLEVIYLSRTYKSVKDC